ncbi:MULTISPECIES: AAA family ATPase [Rhodococcus]|uniref:AAA family ATPase n=1 Tax=Rhodococcus TaxID=1827 RepID=UPI00193BF3E8|nr:MULTISPECIES: AAA family ATPase [Rhodococcus]QRI74708.1 AAA family ATPase [Rhodococcus aetherivorans]QSE58119.1 AAA family ATPase [Rhodococcus sp. PSBB066]
MTAAWDDDEDLRANEPRAYDPAEPWDLIDVDPDAVAMFEAALEAVDGDIDRVSAAALHALVDGLELDEWLEVQLPADHPVNLCRTELEFRDHYQEAKARERAKREERAEAQAEADQRTAEEEAEAKAKAADDYFQRLVKAETQKLRARRDAQEILRREQEGEAPPFDDGLLEEVLARPPEPPYRIEGLIPSDAGTVIVAQRKAGKTTLMLNLARCLLTGEEFLGRFPVVPLTGRLGFLNYEVSAAQLARWADDAGVDRRRLYLANLRGRRNPLGHKQDRAELAGRMKAHGVEAVIVDPFGRAYTGTNQNDAGEVGAWLTDLDSFVRTEVGARDLFLTVHAGWNGERTRGSSAIEDWGDALVFLTKDDMDRRYLKAEGRDVELDEDALDYDPAARRLMLSGAGNRKAAAKRVKADKLMPVVERIVTETPGLNWSALLKAVRAAPDAGEFQDGDVTLAVQLLGGTGRIRREVGGPGKPTLHYPWEPFDPAAGASDDTAPATSAKGSDG